MSTSSPCAMIERRWPARHPDRLQLYSTATPNGVKVSIMLEEIGLPYEAHWIDIGACETRTPEFLSLNPNGKIPAIIDPHGLDGRPLALFESVAIMLYLAEKTRTLLPDDPMQRWETMQWLCWQMAAIGPMFGQVGYFNIFEGREIVDPRPLQHYVAESRRLLGVLDARLTGREWIVGEAFGLADIATLGWVNNLITYYAAREQVGFDDFNNVCEWLARGLARPAVRRGLVIPSRPPSSA